MKRIAIITFHRTNNYGAALQSYALQHVLSNKYKAEILDYRNTYLEGLYLQNEASIKTKIHKLVRRIIYPVRTRQLDKRKERFTNFYTQYHVLSEKIYDKNNITSANECFDLFVAGSDQVWNLHLSRGDWNYFLEFAPPCKRYSYAASIGINNNGQEKERIRNNLNQFQSILVREKKAVSFLSDIGVDKVVTAVCDPVFLLSAKEWKKILPDARFRASPKYILLYTVANVNKSLEIAKRLAYEKNLVVISIGSNQSIKTVSGVENILSAGPIEFLEYIRNADYVVTSSFHALAFSIIFNVPFYYELCKDGSNNNERLENVANIFNLKDREIVGDGQMIQTNNIDWKKVNLVLDNYRQNSREILFNSLMDEEGDKDA